MHSFEGYTAPKDVLEAVRTGRIGSFCLFSAQNVDSPAQLRELTDSLRDAARRGGQLPPLIGIDQEGGQLMAVSRGTTELPGNMAIGATRSPELSAKAGYVLARELLAMGIHMNFAPSLDVNINPANPVIGIRSFGDHPHLVADLGVAMIKGMQGAGVLATAKHFPGHGDIASDTHFDLPVVPHSIERMDAVELYPFRAAIRVGVAAIMTAHILFTALDADLPATLSERVLAKFLGENMGYDGLIITDAMDMHAIAQHGHEYSVTRALTAGADLVLLGHIEDQLNFDSRFQFTPDPKKVQKIQTTRANLVSVPPTMDVIGCTEHRKIAQEIADRSITLVRDNGRLPLRLRPEMKVAVITPRPLDLTPADTSSKVQIQLAEMIAKRHANVITLELAPNASTAEIRALRDAVSDADLVIVGTISAERDLGQAELVETLHREGLALIVVALRTPYDLIAFPMIETYLCAYSIRAVTAEAIARVLFGEIEPQGVLPCALPLQPVHE
jgi:beta-N-acetylhexosaminidase